MRLNADLGEHFGDWKMGDDEQIMRYIDDANVACGYHAGDAWVMQQTLKLTKQYKVNVGAHLAYPDLQGFGRRSMQIPRAQLIAMIHAQIAVLEGLAKCSKQSITYVKPHGALYNDMMKDTVIFETVVLALHSYYQHYPLTVQALADNSKQQNIAAQYNIDLIYEAFADRAYDDKGYLVSRTLPKAVLNEDEALAQVELLLSEGCVLSQSGKRLKVLADTVCVHSDTPDALILCKKIHALVAKLIG